jgi:hypothetical protein
MTLKDPARASLRTAHDYVYATCNVAIKQLAEKEASAVLYTVAGRSPFRLLCSSDMPASECGDVRELIELMISA